MFKYIRMQQNGEARNFLITGTFVFYLEKIEQMEEMLKQQRILYPRSIPNNKSPDYMQGTQGGLDDIDGDAQPNSPTNAPLREKSSMQRKRKKVSSWDHIMNRLKDSADIIGSKIENATNTFNAVFGIERDREDLCKKLNAEMKKVVGLTVRDCNKAVRMLSKNDGLMVIFFTVEDEDKFGWVKDLLDDVA